MPAPRSRSRPSPWEWVQVGLLLVNLAWTTLRLGGYGADTMVVTSALTMTLLIVHLFGRAFGLHVRTESLRSKESAGQTDAGGQVAESNEPKRAYRRVHPAGWWLLPFLAYAAINCTWVTPTPWNGWEDWLNWSQLVAVFWVVLNGIRSAEARKVLLGGLVLLACTAAALACYQRLADPAWMMMGRRQAAQFLGRASGPFGNPNSLAALLLLLLPVTGALTFKSGRSAIQRVLLGSAMALLAIGLVLTVSRGAWIGSALALMAWPLLAPKKRWYWRIGATLAVVILLSGLIGTLYSTVPTMRHRLDRLVEDVGEKSRPVMWRAAWQLFREHPAVGSGAGSYREFFEKYRPDYFQADPHWAHNDYLNTLSDYGLVGFLLLFGDTVAIVWMAWRAAMREGEERERDFYLMRALVIGLMAFSFHLFVDFHLKLPSLAMAFATVAALAVQRARPLRPRGGMPSPWTRLVSAGAAIGICFATLAFVLPHYRGEARRSVMREEIDRSAREEKPLGDPHDLAQRAAGAFARATELDPRNAQAWADRALAKALVARQEKGRESELGREAESHARRALAGSTVVAEFWVRLGVSLDMQGRWVEAGEAFTKALQLAPKRADSWFYHANHIALRTDLYEMREVALNEVAISLRLDPRNRDAEALRQRLLAGP